MRSGVQQHSDGPGHGQDSSHNIAGLGPAKTPGFTTGAALLYVSSYDAV